MSASEVLKDFTKEISGGFDGVVFPFLLGVYQGV